MISFSRILVGVDLSHADRLVSEELSEHCESAVAQAIRLASGTGGEVTFMSVLDISEQALHLIETKESPEISPVHVDAARVLQRLVERAEAAGVKASHRVGLGSSGELILKELVKEKYTLLVIGRRSSTRLSQFLFGRTAIKLLRKSPVPVLIARPDPVREVESILVADDFSENAEQVLDAGVQLARMYEHHLHVVHVIDSLNDAKLAKSGVTSEAIQQLHSTMQEQAQAKLAERLSRTDARTLVYGVMSHVEYGVPEEVIAEKIKEHEVDLLVMGTIGRSGLSAMMLGNTAERLLASVQCSLLAIKPADFVCPVKLG